ncbi:hypothetical protein PHLGIDRAFT_335979 [Phlebiopsis gigantea 11061_1 CR5-6]|uniref:F-box domain-containing protein n=1 Tax=Phlebiopsis gigantea (strain 11061_1 CR5-6) TaxID=745531 RepID=A0A0C3PAE3_PHLG1|nr:hypothetical protein PHLGIDRAFT_335979 [Phlebiopsis gigantea 11061_1 CR5-6]
MASIGLWRPIHADFLSYYNHLHLTLSDIIGLLENCRRVMARLSDLPLSVIRHIRQYAHLRDLLTHIAFQATCRNVRNAYFNDEKFWREACAEGEISKPIPDTDFPFVSARWRDIAIICANHHYICELTMCDPYKCPHEIFKEFRNKPLNTTDGHELEEFAGFDTHLNILSGYASGRRTGLADPRLAHHMDELGNRRIVHAAGLCKFATVPPACGIWITVFSRRRWVYNPSGITQWDVVQVIRKAILSHKGTLTMNDILYAWRAGKHNAAFTRMIHELRWLEHAKGSDVLGFLRELLGLPRNGSKVKERTWKAAEYLYKSIREQPNTRLIDLDLDDETAYKHLSQCSIEDVKMIFAHHTPGRWPQWLVSLIMYSLPKHYVLDHFVFAGMEWIEDFGDEIRPGFKLKWSAIQDGEPVQG